MKKHLVLFWVVFCLSIPHSYSQIEQLPSDCPSYLKSGFKNALKMKDAFESYFDSDMRQEFHELSDTSIQLLESKEILNEISRLDKV